MQHCLEQHKGVLPRYTFHYMNSYQTSLERQIRESLQIENFPCNTIINNKGEWGSNLIPRALSHLESNLPGNKTSGRWQQGSEGVGNTSSPGNNDQDPQQNASSFSEQYTQRKKRRRENKEATDGNKEKSNIAEIGNMSEVASSGNKAQATDSQTWQHQQGMISKSMNTVRVKVGTTVVPNKVRQRKLVTREGVIFLSPDESAQH